ncbi:MAG: Do family serine endopeptidase [Candidatus Omnitrophota bacterium]
MKFRMKIAGVLILFAGIILGFTIAARINVSPEAIAQPISDSVNFSDAIENVSEQVGPTVVSIQTEKIAKPRVQQRRYYASPFGGGSESPFEDDLFNRFFEDFFGEMPDFEQKRSGLGSGVIIDKDGYILTNEHVVSDADIITVTLSDGREFKGTLKGTDPRSDLAVIKISAPNLPVAKLGQSDNIKIGQWVVAIGNPFGYLLSNSEPTVTAGVVSALHRSLPRTSWRDSDYTDLIQTDAAINPGNSGGPLVNLRGEVIGINVAIFTTSGGYQGIGFAIPIDTAKRIVQSLIEGKKVEYGWIGVNIQEIDEKLAKYFSLSGPQTGALVSQILEDSPAQKAGVRNGDIIVAVNDQLVRKPAHLIKVIGNTPVGQKIKLKVLRDKKPLDITVEVAKRPEFDQEGKIITQQTENDDAIEDDGHVSWRGMDVQSLTPELASRLRLENNTGVIVDSVEPTSQADQAGLQRGIVITEINKKPIKNIKDFKDAVKNESGDCLIQTNHGYLVIKFAKE